MSRIPANSRKPSKKASLVSDLLTRTQGLLSPPGGCGTSVEHPDPAYRNKLAVSAGIVIEHRFAFYYWMECKQNLICDIRNRTRWRDEDFKPPDLVSMDWHDDCGGNCDFIEDELLRLNQQNPNEVALFCWLGLRPINDGHMAPAMWLNAIGNAYIIQKQVRDCKRQSHSLNDRFGKSHQVYYFRSPSDFAETFTKTNSESGVLWDVDMDYFTQERCYRDQRYAPRLTSCEIRSLLSPRREWMQLILGNLRGITIALEPEYTGGLSVSLELFREWEKALFAAPLFSKDCRWKPNLLAR